MIVEVLIAQGLCERPLPNQVFDRVLDGLRIAMIEKLLGKALDDVRPGLDLGQQQSAAVGADHAPIEFSDHRTPTQGVKFKLLRVTLRH
jgi:hypothetical protein